jgi:uncharacterized protein YPO0396
LLIPLSESGLAQEKQHDDHKHNFLLRGEENHMKLLDAVDKVLDDENVSGFRLSSFKVLNWGTFDEAIYGIHPRGRNSHMIGENGAGKTTLVDGMLTLIVPSSKRSYNQASGGEKSDRDERSYVRGAYQRKKVVENDEEITQYLRKDNTYTILLAIFSNSKLKQTITLASVFWLQGGKLRKFYAIATKELDIDPHFVIHGDIPGFRKRLRAQGINIYDEVSEYYLRLSSLLGVRSVKAFELFNLGVAMKDIGSLNHFIREKMLEKLDLEQELEEVFAHFENLTLAHDALQLAEKQYALLEPLIADADAYEELQVQFNETQQCANLVPLYIAVQKRALLEIALGEVQQSLAQKRPSAQTLQATLDSLYEQQLKTHAAIQNDAAGQQIQFLTQEIKRYEDQLRLKKVQANAYNRLAEDLGLPVYHDEETFLKTAQQALLMMTQLQEQSVNLQQERDDKKQEMHILVSSMQGINEELASLRERNTQIPTEEIKFRAKHADALGIAVDELPFIGELLRIRETERQWEPAIERFLHQFALRILVPEKHYFQVSRHVDQTYLGGRLVYYRVKENSEYRLNGTENEKKMLYSKLEIKPDTPFSQWLEAELKHSYSYVCCESLEEFQHATRAITLNGQVKHGGNRHEKDDRYKLGNRARYVLGWSNKEKIAALEQDLASKDTLFSTIQAQIQKIEQEYGEATRRKANIDRLLDIKDFETLDWKTDQRQIDKFLEQKHELEASADHLHELKKQLHQINVRIEQVIYEQKQIEKEINGLETKEESYLSQQKECDNFISSSQENRPDLLARIQADFSSSLVTLETLVSLREEMRVYYSDCLGKIRGDLQRLQVSMEHRMEALKQLSPTFVQGVDVSLEALGEYRQLYAQLCYDALPGHRQRFKDLLNEKVVDSVTIFQAVLEQRAEEIKKSIAKLNQLLRTMNYTSTTYIQICPSATKDGDIRNFKEILRTSLPGPGYRDDSSEAMEASFNRISKLVYRLQNEHLWRMKVTDVRNWFDFAAEVRDCKDGTPKNVYSDSAGISGGQKAKLTATILIAALAYQYGLDREEDTERSFRFVLLDEAFIRSDETNTRYILDLLDRFDLQFLVATPMEKIHIIEPYIKTCHLVVNNEDGNDSKVYNMTIEEYRELRKQYQSGEVSDDLAS